MTRATDAVRGCLIVVLLLLAVADLLVIAENAAPTTKCVRGLAEVLCTLSTRENLASGLIAAAGAIFAAWLAWHAVQRQLEWGTLAEARRFYARADAVAAELRIIANSVVKLGRHYSDSLNDFLGTIEREAVIDVASIEPRLAAAIASHIVELQEFKDLHKTVQSASRGHAIIDRFPQAAKDFAMRTEIIAAAIDAACDKFDAREKISVPLVDEATVREIATRRAGDLREIRYASELTSYRPSEAAPPPTGV